MYNKMSKEEETIFLSNTPEGKAARQKALDELATIIKNTKFSSVEEKLQAECLWAVYTALLEQ